MPETRRVPRTDQIYSERLSKLTSIPQGRWMMTSNHPKLGGGFVFSLGSLSDRSTCILINNKGTQLWKADSWSKASSEEITAWSKHTLEVNKSSLCEASEWGLFSVMFIHS